MRVSTTFLAALCLSACAQEADDPNTTLSAQDSLTTYEASEFEPNWFLKLTGGDRLNFSQLDPVAGADMVTYSYEISNQRALPNGWNIQGNGANGDITLEIMSEQNCTHSGSGYTHRDSVIVTTAAQEFRGCGGPILE